MTRRCMHAAYPPGLTHSRLPIKGASTNAFNACLKSRHFRTAAAPARPGLRAAGACDTFRPVMKPATPVPVPPSVHFDGRC